MAITSLCVLKNDLRITDNPALSKAASYDRVIIAYILDESTNSYPLGGASKWWLHNSLDQLNKQLDGKLNFFVGETDQVIKSLIKKHTITNVFWNKSYEPTGIAQQDATKKMLKGFDIEYEEFNGSLLWEPVDVLKKDGTPYKVFTPFYKNGCLSAPAPRKPIGVPKNISPLHVSESVKLADLNLLPTIKWYKKMESEWEVGEKGAHKQLKHFLAHGLDGYKHGRDFPSLPQPSRLSPYLHFGEISPHHIWYEVHQHKKNYAGSDVAHFLSELAWREFAHSMLYHFPELPRKNFQPAFDTFKWHTNHTLLKAWQEGQTGYPIVDAGMRELWATGYMHNRVRMIVGSFLVKNLLIHWHHGEDWFWDTLVDADLASNSFNWQWVAGTGADAAPYFRIFNPVLQGEKFDKEGEYTKKYVPELKNLPAKYLFKPWQAPAHVLAAAGVILGKTYPKPIVDLDESRKRALAAYKYLK